MKTENEQAEIYESGIVYRADKYHVIVSGKDVCVSVYDDRESRRNTFVFGMIAGALLEIIVFLVLLAYNVF